MSSEIKRKVFEAHFNQFTQNIQIPTDIRYQIQLMIEYANNGVHPIKSISKEAIAAIQQHTGVDVSILNIEGISTPSKTEMFSSEEAKEDISVRSIPFNAMDSTCCTYYSMSENTSPEYVYANPVSIPTCSHPKKPFGIHCIVGIKHSQCPHNSPDTGHYADVLDSEGKIKFKVTYQRTVMGNIHFYVVDHNESLINTFSYYASQHNQVPKDDFAKELLDVLSQIDTMANIEKSSLSIIYPTKEQQQTFAVSYISTLIPEKV